MIRKLQRLLRTWKLNWKFASCYSHREFDGKAVMGTCGGSADICGECPYFEKF